MQRKLDHEADLRRVAPEPARAIAIVGIMIAVVCVRAWAYLKDPT